jgi:hypothetical protein
VIFILKLSDKRRFMNERTLNLLSELLVASGSPEPELSLRIENE